MKHSEALEQYKKGEMTAKSLVKNYFLDTAGGMIQKGLNVIHKEIGVCRETFRKYRRILEEENFFKVFPGTFKGNVPNTYIVRPENFEGHGFKSFFGEPMTDEEAKELEEIFAKRKGERLKKITNNKALIDMLQDSKLWNEVMTESNGSFPLGEDFSDEELGIFLSKIISRYRVQGSTRSDAVLQFVGVLKKYCNFKAMQNIVRNATGWVINAIHSGQDFRAEGLDFLWGIKSMRILLQG